MGQKLGPAQRVVLANVASRLAPYAGHTTQAAYTDRMDVARQLAKRGLLVALPLGHPENTGPASMYRLTPAGQAALRGQGPQSHAPIKKSKKPGRQLDHEIATALNRSRAVKISVHAADDDETGEETYTIGDDGGEFDDVAETPAPDVQANIDERRDHYHALGRNVVLDVAAGRGWR
jgi:hypothetical protein